MVTSAECSAHRRDIYGSIVKRWAFLLVVGAFGLVVGAGFNLLLVTSDIAKGAECDQQAASRAARVYKDTLTERYHEQCKRFEGFSSTQRTSIERDAGQTAFETSFNRLSFDEAVNVFAVASVKERKQAWDRLLKKRIDKEDPDPDVLAMYYELKLTQAQVDKQVRADIQVVRNAAWGLTRKGILPQRRDEILQTMRSNKQYEDDFRFVAAAFRNRWLFTLEGKRSGRRVGTPAYWERIRRLRIATKPPAK